MGLSFVLLAVTVEGLRFATERSGVLDLLRRPSWLSRVARRRWLWRTALRLAALVTFTHCYGSGAVTTMSAVARRAWAMPFTSPSFPRGKFVYKNREYLVLKYRTTKTSLQSVVPEPFELPDEPIAQYEFTRTPDSTGFGSYYSVAQTVPVLFNGVPGKYVHSMFIDDDAPIAAGREVWGFPSRLGTVSLRVEKDAMVGELDIGSVRTVTASSGYKHGVCKTAPNLSVPTFTVKIIPRTCVFDPLACAHWSDLRGLMARRGLHATHLPTGAV